jgi:hypothetical protein
VGLSSRDQPSIEVDQELVPSEGGRERSSEQRAPQASAAAGDVALTFMFSAIVVKGGEAGKRCGFFPTEATEFWHPDDERERGAFADTRNAQDEFKSNSEVVVSAQLLGNEAELGQPSRLQPR